MRVASSASRPASGRVRLGRLAIQLGIAFGIAMIAVGMIGFSLADAWVSNRIDSSLSYHNIKWTSAAERGQADDQNIISRIAEWQHRKVLSERTYLLFDPAGRRLAGRLDIAAPPPGYSYVRFTGGGHSYEIGRALATRLRSGSLFVVVQHSEAAASLHALLPVVVLIIAFVGFVLGLSATLLFAHLTAKRLSETQNTAAAIAAGDISRRIATDRLDGMFAVQAESLNHMLDHMDQLVRAQQLFSSNLAHDLRTPLTRLRGLLEKASREGQPAYEALLQRAERECASIIAIFDALLRLAEIETGQHPTAMNPVSLRPLIEDVAETMEPVIADRGGTLSLRQLDDVIVTGDPDLICQLLVNLLENVATHTPPGTSATLSLDQDGDTAVIVVSDDGPGIGASDGVRLTKPFERGAASSMRGGSGLGLAIADAIARFHHGSLDLVDAAPGLAVRIRIPANDAGNAAMTAA